MVVGIDGIFPHHRDLAAGSEIPGISQINVYEVVIEILFFRIDDRVEITVTS